MLLILKCIFFRSLFFKRLSDVYDEEFNRHWKNRMEIKNMLHFLNFIGLKFQLVVIGMMYEKQPSNVGLAIEKALRGIEQINQQALYGIFGDAQWSNKNKLSDRLLIDLIEHFSQYSLSNELVDPDILGQAYEYLIKHFADLTNKKAGSFIRLVQWFICLDLILDPHEGESIYDPACGTGGMLLECVEHLKDSKEDYRTLKLYGQEKNLTSSSIARMNMFLHGIEDFSNCSR
jgi:type I restriction enzyme M protein